MRKLLLFAFLLITCSAYSQKMFDVKGTVTDSANVAMTGASIIVMNASDSVLVSFAITDEEGAFMMKKVEIGEYILQVNFLGYNPFYEKFSHNAEKDFGTIKLGESSANLNEVIVSEERIPIQMKNDTVEYNAEAFKVQPNAAVEDLLKRLPGVEVERDGTVKAQGETVNKIFVDGKEFFGDDPKVATKNLPADAVKKVQVYDRKSETAEFTGIDDGEEQKTINLTLKEDKKKGYFGNATVGYGTEERFETKLNLNRFNKKLQLSVIGNYNNINEQGFSIDDYVSFMGGFGRLMESGGGRVQFGGNGVPINNGLQDGFVTSGAGGLNLSYDFSKKTNLNVSYFYTNISNDVDKTVSRENFLGDNRVFITDENSVTNTQNGNHRANYNLFHKIDSTSDLRFRGNVSMNDGFSDISSDLNTLDAQRQLSNGNDRTYFAEGNSFRGSGNLTYRKRLKKTGRNIVTTLSSGMNDQFQDYDLDAINFITVQNALVYDTLTQNQTQDENQVNYGARLSYTEPLGKGRYFELNLNHQNYDNSVLKDFFDIVEDVPVFNTQLSNHFRRDYFYNRAGFNLRKNTPKANLTIGAMYQNSNLNGDLILLDTVIRQTFNNFLPSADFRYQFSQSKRMNISYRTSISEPSLEELQPIVDNSDPLNIYIGNPNLKPEYRHTMNVRLMLYDQFNFTSLFAFLRGTYTQNKITNQRTISQDFIQTTSPINVENDFTLNGNVSYGAPIRPLKIQFRLSTNATYNRGILFVNTTQNQTERVNGSVSLTVENRKKDKVDISVGGRVGYNETWYSIDDNLNQSFFNQSYFSDFSWNITETLILTNTVDYTVYSQEQFGDELVVPIWKGSLTKFFLNNNKAMIRLTAFDILNKNVGINRNSTFNYIQDERIVSLGRYFLVSLGYNLSGFNQKKGGPRMMITKGR